MSNIINQVPLRAPYSLDKGDLAAVTDAAAKLPGAWNVETEEDYHGHLSIVLIPAGDDLAGPTYLLDGDVAGVQLGACRWERFTRLGGFPDVEAAMAEIRRAIAAMAYNG